ncbi:MAG TPA: response regulator [Ktedonobacterales bacterium]|nr:response regulator [Ktedonobacterales bacterium]
MDEASAPLILVIDDDDAVRSIVAETLKGEGYRVDEASNAAAGLMRVKSGPPDLILLDIVMPVNDGYHFLERLRREGNEAEIPIILVSATHALPDAPHDLGVRAVLTKPFDVGILLAIVERLTRRNQI